jgi:DNA-binding XRE family transcriptional regulator
MELAIEGSREFAVEVDRALKIERIAFAAKVRAARAVLGLSQSEFGAAIGLTQKSVHRIERGEVDPKIRSIAKIEQFWAHQGICFEHLRGGGFRLVVESRVLARG